MSTTPHWNAADYARHSAAQQSWARELIAKLRLTGGEHVLDLGCGDGKVTAEIAAQVPAGRVVGVDNSSDMVAFAAEAFPAAQHGNLRFMQADATALPFRAEFDVVFSNAALHWVVDHAPVLAGIARALRRGGRLLLQMGGRGNAAAVLAAMERVMAAPAWAPCFQGFTFPYGFHARREYRAWMTAVGLVPTRVELLPKDMTQPGGAGLAAWLRTTWLPYTQRVPEPRREEFVAAVVAAYLHDHPPDARGLVHVPMVRLEVEGNLP